MVCRERLIHDLRGDFRCETTGANLLSRFEQIFGGVVEPAFRRDDFDGRECNHRVVRLLQNAAGRFHARDERFNDIFFGFGGVADGEVEVVAHGARGQPVSASAPDPEKNFLRNVLGIRLRADVAKGEGVERLPV